MRPFLAGIDSLLRLLTAASTAVAAVLLVVMAALGGIDVLSSFLLNQPLVLTQELSQVLLAIAVFAALAHSQRRGEHIAVTVISQHAGRRGRPLLQAVALIGQCAFFAFLTWGAWSHTLRSIGIRETAVALYSIPIYPGKVLFAAACTLMLVEILRQLAVLAAGRASQSAGSGAGSPSGDSRQ